MKIKIEIGSRFVEAEIDEKIVEAMQGDRGIPRAAETLCREIEPYIAALLLDDPAHKPIVGIRLLYNAINEYQDLARTYLNRSGVEHAAHEARFRQLREELRSMALLRREHAEMTTDLHHLANWKDADLGNSAFDGPAVKSYARAALAKMGITGPAK